MEKVILLLISVGTEHRYSCAVKNRNSKQSALNIHYPDPTSMIHIIYETKEAYTLSNVQPQDPSQTSQLWEHFGQTDYSANEH
jgi:hypothetical protein